MKTCKKKKISNFVIFCAILIFVPFLFCSCATSLGYVAACPEEALLAALLIGSILEECDFSNLTMPFSSQLIASENEVTPDLNEKICRVLEIINKPSHQIDITGDGKWNCQDRAINFVTLWETYYKEPSMEIIWNYDEWTPNGINHLFVQTYDAKKKKYVQIEPHGKKNWYIMTKVWGKQYKLYENRRGKHDEYMARRKKDIYLTSAEKAYLKEKM